MPKTRLVTAAILLAGMVTGAAATTPWHVWADALRSNVKTKEAAIEVMRKDLRDAQCPKQKNDAVRIACFAAWDWAVARRTAEMAGQQFLLTTAHLDPSTRSKLTGVVSKAVLDEEDNRTTEIGDAFTGIFLPMQTTRR